MGGRVGKAALQAIGTQRGCPQASNTSGILDNLDIVSNSLLQMGQTDGTMVHSYWRNRAEEQAERFGENGFLLRKAVVKD